MQEARREKEGERTGIKGGEGHMELRWRSSMAVLEGCIGSPVCNVILNEILEI